MSHRLPSTLGLQWHRPDSNPLIRSVLESHIPSSKEPPGSQSHAAIYIILSPYWFIFKTWFCFKSELIKLTQADIVVSEWFRGVLIKVLFALFAVATHGVICASVTHATTHPSGQLKYGGIMMTTGRMVVTVATYKKKALRIELNIEYFFWKTSLRLHAFVCRPIAGFHGKSLKKSSQDSQLRPLVLWVHSHWPYTISGLLVVPSCGKHLDACP